MSDSRADVIVVGGGTAGAALAARLSEDEACRVLVLEAGRAFAPDDLPMEVRGLDEQAWVGAEHNWQHQIRLRPGDPAFAVTRGRILGGSSTVNGGIHVRGVPEDFEAWGEELWSWEHVLRCYRRSERDLDFGDDPVHGDSGPIPVSRASRSGYTPLYTAFTEAALAAGHADCPDHNQPRSHGVGPLPRAFEHGSRVGSGTGYLGAATGRPNLRILDRAEVVGLLRDGTTVTGVEVVRDGVRERYEAPRVVLCAGAILTPTLLLRSGIGPADPLRRLGIEPVVDLRGVGAAVHDHPSVHVQLVPSSPAIAPPPGTPGRLQAAATLTSPGCPDRNDVQIMPSYRMDLLALTVMLSLSRSAGRLRLRSADPDVAPAMTMGYLSVADDLLRLASGVSEALRLVRQPALATLGPLHDPDLAAAEGDDAAVAAWVARNLSTLSHTTGTAPIGAPEDGGVVDARGRVHGLDGLSIADLSVVPGPLRNNPSATALMLGERFAELVTEDLRVTL